MRNRPDGTYTVAIRPHHMRPVAGGGTVAPVAHGGTVAPLDGKVLIAELSGSESVIHFAHGPLTWVSQSHGVRPIEVGATARFELDIGQCMYFAPDGTLVAP
jgi:glycerol transport system ATP-binding protein